MEDYRVVASLAAQLLASERRSVPSAVKKARKLLAEARRQTEQDEPCAPGSGTEPIATEADVQAHPS